MESIYKVARTVKRRERSLYNALRSIHHDYSMFIREIALLWPELALLANLRCGLWYAPQFDGVCYFKSTDGHNGNWSFSATRLNLHVAFLAAVKGGCIIVDATRNGKRFPDSMSKTIPIWTCVLNRALAELREIQSPLVSAQQMQTMPRQEIQLEDSSASCEAADGGRQQVLNSSCSTDSSSSLLTHANNLEWDCSLHLPLWVSNTEKNNIERLVEKWVQSFRASGADLSTLAKVLKKPLRPLWVSQKTVIWLNEVPDVSSWNFTPIILVSASEALTSPRRMSDPEFSWSYIAGAADDEESWARGLTPLLFWRHSDELVSGGPELCNCTVAQIVEQDRVYRALRGQDAPQLRKKTGNKMPVLDGAKKDVGVEFSGSKTMGQAVCGNNNVVDCIIECIDPSCSRISDMGNNHIQLPILSSKFDRHSLENHLPAAVDFARKKLETCQSLLIFCADGEDISVCVCLAILLSCFDSTGEYLKDDAVNRCIKKNDVRQCLVYLSSFHSDARPSRGSLKQVYNFLLNKSVSP
ncbi:unnamed protein product [Sphagnum balticum]